MKKIIIISLLILSSIRLAYFTTISLEHNIPKISIILFLHKIALIESNDDFSKVSKNGMLGKYQFKWSTALIHLKKLGLNITRQEFLNNYIIQNRVMMMNLKLNEKILHKYIVKYSNKIIDGVLITKAGILAGSQFGVGRVIEFFDKKGKFDLYDANGVHIKEYMRLFSKIQLD